MSSSNFSGPRKVAVINYKGGTGKTSTVVNLAHGLALAGRRVLIVDTDPQGSSGYHLGVESDKSLYDVLIENRDLDDCIVHARPNLDIIIANERLFPAEISLSRMDNREFLLGQRLAPIERRYDFIILDCAPSINVLNQNALIYSDEIFLPVSMEYLALVGIRQLLNNTRIINKIFKKDITVTKLIPTFIDRRKKKSATVLKSLTRVFESVISTHIRSCVSVAEASGARQTIFEYAPKSKGAEDYGALTQEVLNECRN